MPLKQLDEPCWIIANADGSRAGYWEERHFADEDEAAEVLDCERDDDPAEVAGLAPHQLAAPCHVIVCDGCGKGYSSEDGGGTDHFDSRTDAGWHSGDTKFRKDGTTWCEDCRSWDEPAKETGQ